MRDHVQPAPARGVDVDLDLLFGAVADVDLHAVGEVQQRFLTDAVAEAVERDLEAGGADLAQHGQQFVVDVLFGRDLQDHALGVQRQRRDQEQELTRDVHVGGPVAHELEQADVRDRLGQHARGGLVRVRLGRSQQLETDDPLDIVEDRLTGDDHRGRAIGLPGKASAVRHTPPIDWSTRAQCRARTP